MPVTRARKSLALFVFLSRSWSRRFEVLFLSYSLAHQPLKFKLNWAAGMAWRDISSRNYTLQKLYKYMHDRIRRPSTGEQCFLFMGQVTLWRYSWTGNEYTNVHWRPANATLANLSTPQDFTTEYTGCLFTLVTCK